MLIRFMNMEEKCQKIIFLFFEFNGNRMEKCRKNEDPTTKAHKKQKQEFLPYTKTSKEKEERTFSSQFLREIVQ